MAKEPPIKRTQVTGEVLDYLIQQFSLNQSPSIDVRKYISERTGMTERAVYVWFQNRRAKLRKFERMGKVLPEEYYPQNLWPHQTTNFVPQTNKSTKFAPQTNQTTNVTSRTNMTPKATAQTIPTTNVVVQTIPIQLNDKYCFIECLSISVGSWQRITQGHYEMQALQHPLENLLPSTMNKLMQSSDLMVIVSRKKLEINYFFLAVHNNSKILFRVLYPILLVLQCLLLDNNKDGGKSNELHLKLSCSPMFSVYFLSGPDANLNQWLLCDDFSEGKQVSTAHHTESGTSKPHILVGVKTSLQFLNLFISTNKNMSQKNTPPPPGSVSLPTVF